MRTIITSLIFLILVLQGISQTPNQFNYQAVARNSDGVLISTQNIKIEVSIIQGTLDGSTIYTETHTTQTNGYGVFSIKVGTGTTTENFADINWSSNSFFLKVQIDPNGGDSFEMIGTSQLLSVPYALHSKTAESITGMITETDPIFGESIAKNITTVDITSWNNKLDSEIDGSETNEIQDLSVSNDTIYLTQGGFVKLPPNTEDDPIYSASVAKEITAIDTANWNNKLDSEIDGSETNEIQDLSVSNDTIYLTQGGFVKLPANTESDPIYSASIAKEITAADTVKWNNKLESEIDGSITNELQIISISNDTIFLSQGGFVKLPSSNLLRIYKETTNINCNGDSNGQIELTIEGGESPYYIEWNGTEGTETLSNASAGNYEIYVEDQNGQSSIKKATITQPTAIAATESVTPEDSGNDGEINLTVSGGTPFSGDDYTYEWNDGVTSQDRTGLTEGTYSVTITDQEGCTISKSIDVESAIIEPVAGDVIITEIMYDPDLVGDAQGEWVEIYNTSSEEITANGMQLIDASGSTASFDLNIPAGTHQVISKSDGTINTDVNPDYVINVPALNNTGDGVILKYNGIIIDEVTYTDKSDAGYSIELNPATYDATSNNDMANWNQSTNVYTTGAYGTPGAINTAP
jgi:hypothetical protein